MHFNGLTKVLALATAMASISSVVALPEAMSLKARQGPISCLSEPCNPAEGCCGDAICTPFPYQGMAGVSDPDRRHLGVHWDISDLACDYFLCITIGLHSPDMRRHLRYHVRLLHGRSGDYVHLPPPCRRNCRGMCSRYRCAAYASSKGSCTNFFIGLHS